MPASLQAPQLTLNADCQIVAGDDSLVLLIGLVLYVPFIVATQVMAGLYRRDATVLAETADAQGMLLLKDPSAMLEALETVLPADNLVPKAGGAFGLLFFAWPDWEAPIGLGDPEMERVARLRQVLGAEGAVVGVAPATALDTAPVSAATLQHTTE